MKVQIIIMACRKADDLAVSVASVLRHEPLTPCLVAIDPTYTHEIEEQIDVCKRAGVLFHVWPHMLGQPSAFNRLVELTNADWIYAKHMDSVFTGPTISCLCKAIAPNVAVVQPPVSNCHDIHFGEAEWKNPPKVIPNDGGMVGFDPPAPKLSRLHCEFMIRRDVLKAHPVPSNVYHYDEGLTIVLRKAGLEITRVDECPRVLHLGGRVFPHTIPDYPGASGIDKEQILTELMK